MGTARGEPEGTGTMETWLCGGLVLLTTGLFLLCDVTLDITNCC